MQEQSNRRIVEPKIMVNSMADNLSETNNNSSSL